MSWGKAIFARRAARKPVAPRTVDPALVPLGLEARRALEYADRVLEAVRASLRRGTAAVLDAELACATAERTPGAADGPPSGTARPAEGPAEVPAEDAETWLEPVLAADYDEEGRLAIAPGWLLPASEGHPEEFIPPARATPESIAEGGFGQDGAGAWHILEPVPERLRGAFARGGPLVLEGDAIPGALAQLSAEPLFRPARRVRATRVLEAPRLCRLHLDETVPGWLDLDARYAAGPHEVSLAEVLRASGARYLRRGDDFVALPSGPLVEEARSHEGFKAVEASPGARSAVVRLPFLATLRALAREPERAAAETSARGGAAEALLALAADRTPAHAPLAAGYTGVLRPYQRAGLDWLWSLRRARLGGILADEMGLGKTHMALALIAAAVETDASAPSLVVTPTSVLDAWLEKVAAFAPGLIPVRYAGAGRARLLEGLTPRHLVLTTYGVLVRDAARLGAVAFEVAVLDEAQRVKNPETDAFQAALRIGARMRLGLTGTPIENRPGEIRALLEFAVPGYLPAAARFACIEKAILEGDREATERLRDLVRPFKLRRLKRDVLADLPGKQEETQTCDLTAEQAALYREILAGARAELRRGAGLIPLLGALTRLKRVCDHPALVLPEGRGAELESGKLALLEDLVAKALAGRKKVVVFTQYLEMMDLIERRLDARGIAFAELRGSTRDRAGAVRRFQRDPRCRVMVVSLLAGGLGIDLTSAAVVIHFDRWWNAAREDQATDRVHRIGQTRGVEVLKLVTRGTLEERIDRIIAEKARLMADIVVADDPSALRTLGRDEVAALLEEPRA